jgi:methylated-DNA-[protein]-cysteine S-methyltransferase
MRRLYSILPSPIGELLLVGDGEALTGLYFPGSRKAPALDDAGFARQDAAFRQARSELRAYFAGELTRFELPLGPKGTPFQQRVWQALQRIPYGTTTTYSQVAASLGQPAAARAVGLANARNPIPIIIPCHRLIGASGALTGYGGGLDRKRWLLDLEAAPPGSLPGSVSG